MSNPDMDALINEAVHSLASQLGTWGAPMLGREVTLADGRTGVVDGLGLGRARPDGSRHDGWWLDLKIDGARTTVELDSAQADGVFGQLEPGG